MEKQFITYETSALLDGLNYGYCSQAYFKMEVCGMAMDIPKGVIINNTFPMPEQWQLQKWLRDNHKVHIEIGLENYSDDYIWQYEIVNMDGDYSTRIFDGEYKSYEIALEEALRKALTNLK